MTDASISDSEPSVTLPSGVRRELAAPSLGQRLDALTDDQRQGLAHALYVSQWFNTASYSRTLEYAEIEALKLREYSRSLYRAVCRIAELPAGVDDSGRELVLLHLELEPTGNYWAARGKLWDPERPSTEVVVLDQPARSVALVVALVSLARSILGEAGGEAFHRFNEALGTACDELEEALYPEPTLEQKMATMRERHEASLAAERAETEDEGPEPSFHGEHVD